MRPCPSCGETVHFDTEPACPHCGQPITEEMIQAAMAEYRAQKKHEKEMLFGVRVFHRPGQKT